MGTASSPVYTPFGNQHWSVSTTIHVQPSTLGGNLRGADLRRSSTMYRSNVALREEVNKHAELDPDAREESSKCSPSDNLDVG